MPEMLTLMLSASFGVMNSHLSDLLAKGHMAVSAEKLGPPLGSFPVGPVEGVAVVGVPILCSDAGWTLQLAERCFGHPGRFGPQHDAKVTRSLLKAL